MPRRVPIDKLVKIQENPDHVRNVSILAHVDHGKTTLADSLISSNGIISSRSITDQIRFMDSREDEQLRGITMKTSSISLHHQNNQNEYIINLIDSPGHIDFSSEVSTAVRLSDGCLIVVDVVEGVCPQTKAVLKQAWLEQLKPVLVLNKIDRLITEKKMTKIELYQRLTQILEQVNAAVALLFSSDVMKENERTRTEKEDSQSHHGVQQKRKIKKEAPDFINLDENDYVEINDEGLYFSPESGNVIFASAIHGWGFSISKWAELYSKKIGTPVRTLEHVLFGDYYINQKQKRFCRGAIDKGKEPLFCKMILSYIFEIYDHVTEKNKEKAVEFAKKIGVKLYPRDEKSISTSPDSFLLTLMSQWQSLSDAVLNQIISQVPSPNQISNDRILSLLRSSTNEKIPQSCIDTFHACAPSSDEKIFFISKMISIPKSELPIYKRGPMTMEEIKARRAEIEKLKLSEENNSPAMTSQGGADGEGGVAKEPEEDKSEHVFIAVGRVFSGTIRKGDSLKALSPKYRVGQNDYYDDVIIGDLYMLMGRDLVSIDSAPAGTIVGIGGLKSEMIINSGTLSSTLDVPSFSPIYQDSVPILRVAVEPKDLNDMGALRKGLKLLNIADPCVEIINSVTGELVIAACGEVHLQKCLDDLEKYYAKCPVKPSEPIVPFRETLIEKPKVDEVGESFGAQSKIFMDKFISENVEDEDEDEDQKDEKIPREEIIESEYIIKLFSANRQTRVVLKAFPLAKEVRLFLEQNQKNLLSISRKEMSELEVAKLKSKLMDKFKEANISQPAKTVDSIIALGPNGCGSNILINDIESYQDRSNYWSSKSENLKQFDAQLVSGFQLATQSGPLCEEPMSGVGIRLLEWDLYNDQEDFNVTTTSGQLISTMKEAVRKVYLIAHKRLLAAMYTCNIQTTSEVLGKLYGVIAKRNGKILEDDMIEGTNLFNINAELPVIESFGFADDIRKKTSGLAFPQLKFSHWGLIEGDPLWVPTTEEEIQHYGEKADYESISRKYMNKIRKRKGLWVDEKIVEHADKQRTITKNK